MSQLVAVIDMPYGSAGRLCLAESGAGWEHWGGAAVDGVDDLAAVDSLEVDAGDAEVGMS